MLLNKIPDYDCDQYEEKLLEKHSNIVYEQEVDFSNGRNDTQQIVRKTQIATIIQKLKPKDLVTQIHITHKFTLITRLGCFYVTAILKFS